MAAPLGNSNAVKAKPWQAAINRALSKRTLVSQRDALDDLAEKLLSQCDEGDMTALKELGDRLDGKAVQSTTLSNEDGSPLLTGITVTFVKPSDPE